MMMHDTISLDCGVSVCSTRAWLLSSNAHAQTRLGESTVLVRLISRPRSTLVLAGVTSIRPFKAFAVRISNPALQPVLHLPLVLSFMTLIVAWFICYLTCAFLGVRFPGQEIGLYRTLQLWASWCTRSSRHKWSQIPFFLAQRPCAIFCLPFFCQSLFTWLNTWFLFSIRF